MAKGTNQETVSGYFRKLFDENPAWLDSRSNQDLLDRWLKSVLRKNPASRVAGWSRWRRGSTGAWTWRGTLTVRVWPA
jgi:hypothetical protein